MRGLSLTPIVVVLACGGSPKPAPVEPTPAKSSNPLPTRHYVDDSEPTEGVTVLNARGKMDPADIEVGIQPHAGALTECYTSRVSGRRWLGGSVQIHWDIAKDGTITAVKLIDSDLGSWPIEKCLLDIARAAKFAPPKGGDADFMVPLTFSAKGGALAWDEDKGLRAVGGQLAKLDACVKDRKVKQKTPPDDVTITVYVGPHGAAQSVGFASKASVLDDAWADCAEKAALAWRLPDPRGQVAKLAVRYRAN